MIAFDHVSIALGDFTLEDISFTVKKGEYFFIIGPSGAGKTILLEAIAGLHVPDQGRILLAGKDVSMIPPEQRGVGLVYQDYSLFPHMTVEKNIAFGLKMHHLPLPEIKNTVEGLLSRFGIEHLRSRATLTLSGGEMQRVALARALAIDPDVLLLDEPLSALDPGMKEHFIHVLKDIHQENGLTIIQVSHDRHEILSLGTRMALVMDGCLEQEGSVRQVYAAPASRRVAGFIGYENVIDGVVVSSRDGECLIDVSGVILRTSCTIPEGRKVTFCIGADEIVVHPIEAQVAGDENAVRGVVTAVSQAGYLTRVRIDAGITFSAVMVREAADTMALKVGSPVLFTIRKTAIRIIGQ
ncbi:MAG TPA: ABC transporter ATP-binding protein [Methanoregulaceae archaeon]|jgi:ABC-type Fe3+/spermidine/putrescine transport system ATPase subunit|nr:ABC transporter ATP-binding protein [Methanoregulaceae archaeon]